MKEVLTKKFWQGVKKTFDEALKGPPPEENGQVESERQPIVGAKDDPRPAGEVGKEHEP